MFKTILLSVFMLASWPVYSQAFESQEIRCKFEAYTAAVGHQAKLGGITKPVFDSKMKELEASPEISQERKGAGLPAMKWGYMQDKDLDSQEVGFVRYTICMKHKDI